ncbi:ADAMTS-like protein 1 [Electrophorus electricus]|uniref:ADAMTS-like protein 1 n=1 Tax=Electrophorus electricus TaxID=8005 RepID=UPI0015D03D86|nr:ADAMTS-like protein 1 [Electrophorus electricus]
MIKMCEDGALARSDPASERGSFIRAGLCGDFIYQSVCVRVHMRVCFSRFIRGSWGPCSRTCGAGTQRRTVRCQVLLSFSQAVADLPDDECEGPKPAESQPCYRAPCQGVRAEADNDRTQTTATGREELHDWEYKGFTECSETCDGACGTLRPCSRMKEAVVICLNKQTREAADERECVSARRPPQLIQACHTRPCPPRWVAAAWSFCSATCGVGLQTRAVSCVPKGRAHGNRTESIKDEECEQPKPPSVQACNRFDCPPTWDVQEWTQCSQTCGGGSQKREVTCKQRMADGSVLELPETFCPSPGLPAEQACGQIDCPAHWIFANWTQCSATCGEGTQRLLVVCRRQEPSGQYRTVLPEACASIPKPSTARSCSTGPCEKTFKPAVAKPKPTILAQQKVYIQWRKGPKLHLVVGGYAYLLPWTSVVLRCPTRHFHKGHVRWLKDGKPLTLPPHVSISHMGYVKIQQVRASDVGMYTCIAEQTQESFVLKLIGNKQKVSVSETDLWVTDDVKSSPKTFQMSSTPEEKAKEVLSLNRYDTIVQHLLDLKDLLLLHFAEKNGSLQEEDTSLESQAPQVLVADMPKLDEITSNLSGSLQELQTHELLMQLLGDPSKNTGENNESTLEPHERPELSAQGYISQETDLLASHSTRQWRGHFRSPVITQKPSRSHTLTHKIVAHVGGVVVVPRQVTRLELKCQAQGNPQPTIIWTKEGMELTNHSRVGLMPDGSLHIEAPRETDSGFYTCRATNRVGSTSLSSRVQITENGCVTGSGESNSSFCSDNVQSFNSCHGHHCHQRWQVSSWSACSVSCGGGLQSRSVTCLGLAGGVRTCTAAGRRPAENRLCNSQPCFGWTTVSWGPCHGKCVGPRQALQHRHVFCQDKNNTRVANQLCSSQPRPSSYRNCTTQACALQWRVGPWTQCTATCGRHGFQSRHVTCVHHRSGKLARELQCAWRRRPASWQRCNILSCGKGTGECQDSTRYCEKVRQLQLCPLPQFKARCCRSCKGT